SEEHTSELQSRENLVCRLLLEKKKFLFRTGHDSSRRIVGEELHIPIQGPSNNQTLPAFATRTNVRSIGRSSIGRVAKTECRVVRYVCWDSSVGPKTHWACA